MADRYLQLTQSHWGRVLASRIGLSTPPRLRRAAAGYRQEPLSARRVHVSAIGTAALAPEILAALYGAGAQLLADPAYETWPRLNSAAESCGLALKSEATSGNETIEAVVVDASGLAAVDDLRGLLQVLQPRLRQIDRCGRIVIVGDLPSGCDSPASAALAAGLDGFVRALGKEQGRRGVTVNRITVALGAEEQLAGPLRWLLSEHSAFVSGQTLTLTPDQQAPAGEFVLPLRGRQAIVTGAAQGIGAAIVRALAREGAHVIGVDRPEEEAALVETVGQHGGHALMMDITGPGAARRLVDEAGAVDIVVHNAGVIRDRTLGRMTPEQWDLVMAVNLQAILSINERLLADDEPGGLKAGGRIVALSSISGLAGNPGQTNYSTTKAALIGYAARFAQRIDPERAAMNVVAPGMIETRMTDSMPTFPREIGRRLNALSQGGLPIDVAEAVTFLASPLAAGINGRCLRVCGLNLIGA